LVFARFVIVYISLDSRKPPLSAILALLCLGTAPFAAEPADSLAYEAKRRQILESAPDERATLSLGAAEDLARDGYYAEALDLIFSMQDTTGTIEDWDPERADTARKAPALGLPGLGSPSVPASGYVQSTLDYDDWDYEDQPIGGRVRAKMEWDPPGRNVDRVTALFQGSDRNAYFDLSGKGTAFGRLLKLEADALAEKKFWQTTGDSLDRAFAQVRAEANTRALGKPVSVVAPVYAEAEAYRHDRFGSRSYQAVGASPGVEAVSADLRKSLLLSWELRRTSYPSAPSSGYLRNGPSASGEWYGDRVTVDAETRFQTSGYDRDTSLYFLRELETRASLFVRTWRWLRVGFKALGESETGDYSDSVDITILERIRAGYRLQGASWSLQPGLVAEWASAYTANLSLSYTRGRYPILYAVEGGTLETPKYLEESNDDWRAETGLTILAKAIFFTLSMDYEENWVPYSLIYTLGSSRGAGLNANLFWKLRPWMEIDFTCMASHRLDDAGTPGRIQDNVSLSLGLTSRFP
jgi:hypothetical protein